MFINTHTYVYVYIYIYIYIFAGGLLPGLVLAGGLSCARVRRLSPERYDNIDNDNNVDMNTNFNVNVNDNTNDDNDYVLQKL